MKGVFSRQLPLWAARAQPAGETGRRYGTHLSMCLTSLGSGLLGMNTSAPFSHGLRAALRGGQLFRSAVGEPLQQAEKALRQLEGRLWCIVGVGPEGDMGGAPQIRLQGSYLFNSTFSPHRLQVVRKYLLKDWMERGKVKTKEKIRMKVGNP